MFYGYSTWPDKGPFPDPPAVTGESSPCMLGFIEDFGGNAHRERCDRTIPTGHRVAPVAKAGGKISQSLVDDVEAGRYGRPGQEVHLANCVGVENESVTRRRRAEHGQVSA